MATNLKHNFEDTHISLNVIEPTNVTGNDAHIARRFWTDQEKPVVNNQPVSKDTKNSWYGQFMSCMEIDWGNAKGDDENNFDKSTISESAIRDILFTNGIKTSDELLTVLCWLYHNRYVAPLPIYSISWNGNGATTNASTDGSSTMEYTFNNWWTSATDGSQVTNATVPTGDSTYFAHWTPNAITLPTSNPKRKYAITWNVNGGTGTPTGGTAEVTYTFNNWWTKASGGSQVTQRTTATANATYYAHWTAPTSITLPNNPTRSGYTFKGWAKTNSATTPNVTASTIPTSNITYYAVWESSINYYYYAGWTLPTASNVDTIIAETYPSASGSSTNNTAGKKTTSKSTMDYTSNSLYKGSDGVKATYYVLVPTGHAIYDPLDNNVVEDLFTSKGNITIGNQTHTIYEYNGISRNINAIIIK